MHFNNVCTLHTFFAVISGSFYTILADNASLSVLLKTAKAERDDIAEEYDH